MHLVQLLLPLFDKAGGAQPLSLFRGVERELVDRFGGVTAFERSPARGRWRDEEGKVERDDIVIFEVMTSDLDRAWWHSYGRELAAKFGQEQLVVRSMTMETL